MKRTLIATPGNESDNEARCWKSLQQQTEIALLDDVPPGGRPEKSWEPAAKPAGPELSGSEIIAGTNAVGFPERGWFGEIVRLKAVNAPTFAPR